MAPSNCGFHQIGARSLNRVIDCFVGISRINQNLSPIPCDYIAVPRCLSTYSVLILLHLWTLTPKSLQNAGSIFSGGTERIHQSVDPTPIEHTESADLSKVPGRLQTYGFLSCHDFISKLLEPFFRMF